MVWRPLWFGAGLAQAKQHAVGQAVGLSLGRLLGGRKLNFPEVSQWAEAENQDSSLKAPSRPIQCSGQCQEVRKHRCYPLGAGPLLASRVQVQP